MFNIFNKNKRPENLKEVIGQLKKLETETKRISGELKRLKEKTRFSVQKVGIVRFNPFSGVGGDQSFSAALLNENNNGVVITSLFTREANRVYGKPVEDGKSEYSLSDEEKQAIERAIGS